MFNSISDLSWYAVLIAFVVYFGLGAVWFTVFFKEKYLVSLGKENEKQQDVAPIFIIGPAVCTLVITLTSAILMNALGTQTYGDTVVFSLFIGFGFLVANTVNIAINPNIPRPLLYGVISGTYHLVGISLANLIIAALS